MISKELISAVLKLKVCEVVSITLEKNTDFMRLDYECIKILIDESLANKQGLVRGYSVRYINIHELAHKCKEWASKQDEKYTSFLSGRDTKSNHKCYFAYLPLILDKDEYCKQFRADTEPEAIFKACEWILKEKQ